MTAPFSPPPWTPAPRPPRVWLWALTTVVLTGVAIAATAATTYVIAHSASTTSAAAPTAPPASALTPAQRADAKQAVCHAFDVSSRGMDTQGGARVDGNPNLPMLLRMLSGTVSIEQALTPATPDDIAGPAHSVVTTNLDLLNAALGQASISDVKTATSVSNDAVDALVSACGLPH